MVPSMCLFRWINRIISKRAHAISKIVFILGLKKFLACLERVRGYAWSFSHSDPDPSSVIYVVVELDSLTNFFSFFQLGFVVDIKELVLYHLLTHETREVKKPIILTMILVADICFALLIQRKVVRLSYIDPMEYYCKPSILNVLIILANVIFSVGVIVPYAFSDGTVLFDAISITMWSYCIDVYVFTYLYLNIPKRKYVTRLISKICLRSE